MTIKQIKSGEHLYPEPTAAAGADWKIIKMNV